MPNAVESVASPTTTRDTEEQIWESWGYSTGALAETAVLLLSPRPLGMVLRDITTAPKDGEHEDAWTHTLRYELAGPFDPDPEVTPDPGDPPVTPSSSINFEVGRKTRRVSRGIAERKYGILSQMPDFDGGIDWDGEQFRGTDIIEPFFTWSETHYFPIADVDNGYIADVGDLVGKTNDGTFRGFTAGEVLFLGASGAKRDGNFWEVTFHFAMKPNQSGVTIGDTSGIDIGGWEEVWEYGAVDVDPTANQLAPTNIGVYVDQLYYPGSFGNLSIGTA